MKHYLFCLCICLCCFHANAQVPNSSFELWDSTAGYLSPVGWDNLNALTNPTGINTCERIAPGYSGDFYLALNTETIPGMGILPGIAACGKLDPVTHYPVSGFPFTGRPQVLAGMWQYMPFHVADSGHIAILLSKWNTISSSRDTVAFSSYKLPGMVMTWTQFQIGLNYRDTSTPDSAMIYLTASSASPVAYSFLWVDDLALRDSIPPTTQIKGLTNNQLSTALYPNPAKEQTTLRYSAISNSDITVTINDMDGRCIKSLKFQVYNGTNELPLNTTGILPGLYFIRTTGGEETTQLKLIID